MIKSWQPRDVITAIMLVGAFTLRAIGIDTITTYIIIAIAVGYLGLSIPRKPTGGS